MSDTVEGARLGVAARAAVPPFHVIDVSAAAAQRQRSHGDLVDLSPGSSSATGAGAGSRPPRAALERDVLGYTVVLGIPELRAEIAAHYARRYQGAVNSGSGRDLLQVVRGLYGIWNWRFGRANEIKRSRFCGPPEGFPYEGLDAPETSVLGRNGGQSGGIGIGSGAHGVRSRQGAIRCSPAALERRPNLSFHEIGRLRL